MTNPEDDIVIDLRASCTKDEAIAKLLGWLKGPLHPKYIRVSERGLDESHLIQLTTLDDSLESQLHELRENASQSLIDAVESDETGDVLEEKKRAVEQVEELIKRAFFYKTELTDEISKGSSSKLKIDQEATQNSDQLHITLKSLDDWARDKLSVSVLDHGKYAHKVASSIDESDEDETVPHDGNDDSGIETGLSLIKAKGLYVTLAYLVEALVSQSQKRPDSRFGGDAPNVDAISKYLAELAEARIPDGNHKYQGQSSDTIVKRIKQAIAVRTKHERKL